jgi:hypothetical protein
MALDMEEIRMQFEFLTNCGDYVPLEKIRTTFGCTMIHSLDHGKVVTANDRRWVKTSLSALLYVNSQSQLALRTHPTKGLSCSTKSRDFILL